MNNISITQQSIDKFEEALISTLKSYETLINGLQKTLDFYAASQAPVIISPEMYQQSMLLLRGIDNNIFHIAQLECPELPRTYLDEMRSLMEAPEIQIGANGIPVQTMMLRVKARHRIADLALDWYRQKGKKQKHWLVSVLKPFPIKAEEIPEQHMIFYGDTPGIIRLIQGTRNEERSAAEAGFAFKEYPNKKVVAWDSLYQFASKKGGPLAITKVKVWELNKRLKRLFVVNEKLIIPAEHGAYKTRFRCLVYNSRA